MKTRYALIVSVLILSLLTLFACDTPIQADPPNLGPYAITGTLSKLGCECGYGGIDYQSYIDGEKEITELSRSYKASFVVQHPEQDRSSSCLGGVL